MERSESTDLVIYKKHTQPNHQKTKTDTQPNGTAAVILDKKPCFSVCAGPGICAGLFAHPTPQILPPQPCLSFLPITEGEKVSFPLDPKVRHCVPHRYVWEKMI